MEEIIKETAPQEQPVYINANGARIFTYPMKVNLIRFNGFSEQHNITTF